MPGAGYLQGVRIIANTDGKLNDIIANTDGKLNDIIANTDGKLNDSTFLTASHCNNVVIVVM